MKWSILLASPAGGAVSDREKGVRRERRGRTTNGSGVRDPWCGRRILCDQSETPRVADSVRSTLPALVVAFMAPTCGLGSVPPTRQVTCWLTRSGDTFRITF